MITLMAIPPERVKSEWRWIEPLLFRAMIKVKRKHFETIEVLRRLIRNEATAYTVSGDQGSGVVILAIHGDYLQPEFASGSTDLRGEFKAFANSLIEQFETCARQHDCSEIRVYGRPAWSRILTGFVLTEIDGERVLCRKVSHADNE